VSVITPVQTSPRAANFATTVTGTLTGVTAGNFLIIGLLYSNQTGIITTAGNVADSSGDTWHLAVTTTPYTGGGNYTAAAIFYAVNVASGTHNVAFTNPDTNVPAAVFYVEEFSFGGTSATADQIASNVSTSSISTLASGTTPSITGSDELVFTILASLGISGSPVIGAPSGYTATGLDSNVGGFLYGSAWKTATSGTQSATWSWPGGTTTGAASAIATFAASSAGGLFVNPLSGRGGAAANPLVN
jgi:hypothetical protein